MSAPMRLEGVGYELPLCLLAALAEVPENWREAWIDRYITGLPHMSASRRQMAWNANRVLRELLVDRVAA